MNQRLKQALSQRQKFHLVDASRISSAVLIPLFEKKGESHILFTKRTTKVKDHKGQISFPGGAYEEWDRTLLNTALRECTEEIGLAAEVVELLGELDDMFTIGSGYIISPFVGAVPWPYSLKLDAFEVAEIIEVPISALLDRDYVLREAEIVDGTVVPSYSYHYQGNVIWGATARILNQFLDIYTRVMDNTGE